MKHNIAVSLMKLLIKRQTGAGDFIGLGPNWEWIEIVDSPFDYPILWGLKKLRIVGFTFCKNNP